jgi:hypothetical protein
VIALPFVSVGSRSGPLAQPYVRSDSLVLQQAFEPRNLMLGFGGAPGEVKMSIKNYVKTRFYGRADATNHHVCC